MLAYKRELIVTIMVSVSSMVSGLKMYDPLIGLNAAYYSAAAYCNKTTIQDWSCGMPCTLKSTVINITQIENINTNTYGYVAYNEGENQIIVAFRG